MKYPPLYKITDLFQERKNNHISIKKNVHVAFQNEYPTI